jgi:hypothetical protein
MERRPHFGLAHRGVRRMKTRQRETPIQTSRTRTTAVELADLIRTQSDTVSCGVTLKQRDKPTLWRRICLACLRVALGMKVQDGLEMHRRSVH